MLPRAGHRPAAGLLASGVAAGRSAPVAATAAAAASAFGHS
jgi:hypothetical protein